MFEPEKPPVETDSSRRRIFILVAVITGTVILLGVLLIARRAPSGVSAQPQLEGAIRAGSPDFQTYLDRIFVDFNPDENATEASRPLGDIVMEMRPTIRNFTGRTIDGLELHATVVDLDNNPVKEKTVVRQVEIEPNKTLVVPILMEGFKKDDTRANIRIVVTGFRFQS